MTELVFSYSYFEGGIDIKLEGENTVSRINMVIDRVLLVIFGYHVWNRIERYI